MARPTVADAMSHRLVCVLEHTTFKEIVRVLADNHVDLLPVVDAERRVVGVVTSSDLLARFGARMVSRTHHKHGTTAAELMTAPPVTTTPHADLEDAARLAVHERVSALPVVDKFGMLLGVLTLTDIATLFLRADDDIAGEVRREIGSRPSSVEAIGVEVHDGVVTLTGWVATAADGRRLVEAVRRVEGVVAVHNDLDWERGDVREVAHQLTELIHPKGTTQ